MSKWRVYTIGELVKDKIIAPPMDGNHGDIHPKGNDFVFEGIPFIMASDIKDGVISFDECKFITKNQADGLRKGFAQEGDVLLTHKATIGRTAIVPKTKYPYLMLTPQVTYYRVIDTKLLENRYLKYCFDNDTFQKSLGLWAGAGSTRAYLGILGQHNLAIKIPCVETQRKIADVLSVLDNKIACNNRINTELEAMAKTLYDYWFVQFDFPDANGKPYKTSGGKMEYNTTLKREIPTGWRASNILSLANLLGGGTPTKTKPEYWNGSIPFFTPTDSDKNIYSLNTQDSITELGLKNSSTRLFEKNTIFITARGSVGRLALNAVPMAMNQSCYALKAKQGVSFAFLYFITKELIHHLEVKATGSVFNSIISNDIEYTYLALPEDNDLIDKYAKKTELAFAKIELLTKENQHLIALRDWLLPLLMNGQVKVK
ncbi:restriction endonuclease subunit S [Serratia fonticola]